jgi:hypothetical protein
MTWKFGAALGPAVATLPSRPDLTVLSLPYFGTTPATLETLQKGGIAVFGADLWAGDWNPMTPAQQLKLLTDRLKLPARASSCCTIRRRRPRRCCRPFCATSATITTVWSTSSRQMPKPCPARHIKAKIGMKFSRLKHDSSRLV